MSKKNKTLKNLLVAIPSLALVSAPLFTLASCGGKKLVDMELSSTPASVEVGRTFRISAKLKYNKNAEDTIKWTSKGEGKVTFNQTESKSDEQIIVTCTGEGIATITATCGDFKKQCSVIITPSTEVTELLSVTYTGSGIAGKAGDFVGQKFTADKIKVRGKVAGQEQDLILGKQFIVKENNVDITEKISKGTMTPFETSGYYDYVIYAVSSKSIQPMTISVHVEETKTISLTPDEDSFIFQYLELEEYTKETITNTPGGTASASWTIKTPKDYAQKFKFTFKKGESVKFTKEIMLAKDAGKLTIEFTKEEWENFDDGMDLTIEAEYILKKCEVVAADDFKEYFDIVSITPNPAIECEDEDDETLIYFIVRPKASFVPGKAYIIPKSDPTFIIDSGDITTPSPQTTFDFSVGPLSWHKILYGDTIELHYEVS